MAFTAALGGAWERGWVLAAFLEPVLISGSIKNLVTPRRGYDKLTCTVFRPGKLS